MRSKRRARWQLYCVVAAALTVAGAAGAPAPAIERAPLPAVGAWDVVRVAVDRNDQPHWLYVPDDPRWLGRELMISALALSFNDGSPPCGQPSWATRKTRLGQLIATSFSRSPRLGLPAGPLPADFGLDERASKSVSVKTVRCQADEAAQPWSQP